MLLSGPEQGNHCVSLGQLTLAQEGVESPSPAGQIQKAWLSHKGFQGYPQNTLGLVSKTKQGPVHYEMGHRPRLHFSILHLRCFSAGWFLRNAGLTFWGWVPGQDHSALCPRFPWRGSLCSQRRSSWWPRALMDDRHWPLEEGWAIVHSAHLTDIIQNHIDDNNNMNQNHDFLFLLPTMCQA